MPIQPRIAQPIDLAAEQASIASHAVSRLALHAVARLRATRLARSLKPFIARGSRKERCMGCRVMHSHCLCALRPSVPTQAGVCA